MPVHSKMLQRGQENELDHLHINIIQTQSFLGEVSFEKQRWGEKSGLTFEIISEAKLSILAENNL